MAATATLDGRYQLERALGGGGMGIVWLARDLTTGVSVAVKILHGLDDAGPRFGREADALLGVRHPGVVSYVAHGVTADGRGYLAMEWIDGVTLAARLVETPLSLAEVIALGRRLAATLAAVHRAGIIHRDIKPANVLLPGGAVDQAKVCDFGLARLVGGRRHTRTGTVLGTPGYLAPEQARGAAVDARADVFALGCVLWEAIGGHSPFDADHVSAVLARILFDEAPRLRDVDPTLPADLDDLVAAMLARDAAGRPSMDEVEAALRGLTGVDGATRTTASRARRSLSDEERSLVAVVVASRAGDTSRAGDDEATVRLTPVDAPELSGLSSQIAALGARLDSVRDDRVVVSLAGTGAATDRAARAARVALLLRDTFPDARVGAAMGRAAAGRDTIGPVLDLATAATARARPGQAGLDADLAALLDGRFALAVEGSTDTPPPGPAPPALLIGDLHGDAVRPVLGRIPPCIGRDRELATLEAAFVECVDEGVARATVITGPPGIGKTRLRHELVGRLAHRERTTAVWLARADSVGAGAPFGLLAQLVESGLGDAGGDATAGRAWLDEAVAAIGVAEPVRVADFAAELLGRPRRNPVPDGVAAALRDRALMRDQLRRAWLELVGAALVRGPVALVIEDLHWGDLPTIEAVDAALVELAEQPLFVVAFARPELDERFGSLWSERGADRLRLGPLTRRAAGRLARELLGSAAEPDAVERVVELATGNPFYLEELVRARVAGRDDAPPSVQAMVAARLEALDRPLRRALRAASVFGQHVRADAIAALVGAPAAEVDVWIDALIAAEVLVVARPGPPRDLAFRHALVRDAAYDMLTPVDRARGHRAAAHWWIDAGAADPLVVAEHLTVGGQPDQAAPYFARAARAALDGDDLHAALAHAKRGLDHADAASAVALHTAATQARRWLGDGTGAIAEGRAALALASRGSAAWFDAIAAMASALGQCGERQALEALAQEAAAAPVEGEARQSRGAAMAELATQLVLQAGRNDLAAALIADLDDRDLPPDVVLQVLSARHDIALGQGDLGEAVRHQRRLLELAAATDNAREVARGQVNLGFVLGQLGDLTGAERELHLARAGAGRLGLPRLEGAAWHNLGDMLRRQGRLDEARAAEERAIAVFERVVDPRFLGSSLIYLGEILGDAGDLDGAIAACRQAVTTLHDVPPSRAQALGTLAGLLVRAGRGREALAPAEEAMALVDAMGGTDEGESRIRLSLIEARAAVGDAAGAAAARVTAVARLQARAAAISDPELARSFLERVEENARTLAAT